MGKKVYIFLADGFEEIEGLTVVDLMRRAKIDIQTVSITDTREITGSHGICLKTDLIFGQTDFTDADMLVLPGGMPGTKHLRDYEPLAELLLAFHEKKGRIGAICAAPTVLSGLGILSDRSVTSYPSCEPDIKAKQYLTDEVVVDGNIITSRGLGTAIPFALCLISQLLGREKAEEIRQSIVYRAS